MREKDNREREITMGEGDPRSSAQGRADLRHARCYSSSVSEPQKSVKTAQKILLSCDRNFISNPSPGAGGNSWRSSDDNQSRTDHLL